MDKNFDNIPYGQHHIDKNDIDSVIKVLNSNFITQGPQVPLFEKIISRYCGSKYAVAVNSSTSALHLACISLGLKENDWLWTSPISFVASANCGLLCGAKIDFVDIDPNTFNLCPSALEKKLILAEKNGKLPKVLIPVHLCGQSCDMKSIYKLSKKYGFKIIEDASHAIGGKYLNQPIGCCSYSDITVFSFHPVKIITTGEGGMALTNKKKYADKMRLLRTHGITREPKLMKCKSPGQWFYQQIDLGYNYRMTDIQAALGISQFKRLDSIVSKRNTLAKRYDKLLSKLPLKLPYRNKNILSSFHLYVIRLIDTQKHKFVFDSLRKSGIGVNLHYIPIYRHPYYNNAENLIKQYPESESYYASAITIPLFINMSRVEQDYIVKEIEKYL